MICIRAAIKAHKEAIRGRWLKVKHYGLPPDGRYEIRLCPNGRVHRANVNGPDIWILGSRAPIPFRQALPKLSRIQ